jgi:hypothetical protein
MIQSIIASLRFKTLKNKFCLEPVIFKKVKIQLTLKQAVKVERWSTGYSCTLSLISALDGVSGQRHAALPKERPDTHFLGGWLEPRLVWTGAEYLASTGIQSPGSR